MIINVKVIPKAKQNLVRPLDDKNFKVYVTSPPEKNKANIVLIELLSKFYKIRKNDIEIIRGLHSHNKVIAVNL